MVDSRGACPCPRVLVMKGRRRPAAPGAAGPSSSVAMGSTTGSTPEDPTAPVPTASAGPHRPDRLGRVGRRPVVMAALLGATGLAGCSPQGTRTASPSTTAPAPSPATATPTPSGTASADPLAGWTLEEKVGQLLMVGVDASAPAPASTDAVVSHHVGNIFISGRSHAGGPAVREVITSFTDLVGPTTTRNTPLLVATDQEGGEVQVLAGPGFSTIPSALDQSAQTADQLLSSATAWGRELADVGVTMNLAPVADLVDIADPSTNGPIGQWGREYGHDAATVSSRATAFAQGMQAGGVIPTYKHFPGLGRVSENTDVASQVTDTVTTRSGDQAVSVFANAIAAGAQSIMMSSAVYSHIDGASPAVFSSVAVTDMLRTEMGFTGVVMTDDVAGAAQVLDWEAGERALLAVKAGCDLVLAAADPAVAAQMAQALAAAARADPVVAARVDESARRVLALKDSRQQSTPDS